MRVWLLLIAVLLVACGRRAIHEPLATAQHSTTTTCVTIQRGTAGSVEDANLNPALPTKNYGSSSSLTTGQALAPGSTPREGLLRFDISSVPAGQIIVSATVTLTRVLAFDAQVATNAHIVTAAWAESTVTYGNFAGAASPAVAATFPPTVTSSADLTGLVASWYAGAVPNYGLWLERDYTGGTSFASSEFSTQAQRPSLYVCYTQAPTCTDGIQNGTETDVDCGGGDCSACANTESCSTHTDCLSGLCYGSICYPTGVDGSVVTSCTLPTIPSGVGESTQVYDSGKSSTGWGYLWTPPTGTQVLGSALLVHGGRWRDGATAVGTPGIPGAYDDVDTGKKLAGLGYITYSPAYRSSQSTAHRAQASDVLCAGRWLRDYMLTNHTEVPSAIFVLGASAGAHLSALVAHAPSSAVDDASCPLSGAVAWRGVIAWSGIYDLTADLTGYSSAQSGVAELLGYAPSSNAAGALAASPWSYVNPFSSPQMIAHGVADPTLPVSGSNDFHVQALLSGVSSTLVVVPVNPGFGFLHAGNLFHSLRPSQGCTALAFLAAN